MTTATELGRHVILPLVELAFQEMRVNNRRQAALCKSDGVERRVGEWQGSSLLG